MVLSSLIPPEAARGKRGLPGRNPGRSVCCGFQARGDVPEPDRDVAGRSLHTFEETLRVEVVPEDEGGFLFGSASTLSDPQAPVSAIAYLPLVSG